MLQWAAPYDSSKLGRREIGGVWGIWAWFMLLVIAKFLNIYKYACNLKHGPKNDPAESVSEFPADSEHNWTHVPFVITLNVFYPRKTNHEAVGHCLKAHGQEGVGQWPVASLGGTVVASVYEWATHRNQDLEGIGDHGACELNIVAAIGTGAEFTCDSVRYNGSGGGPMIFTARGHLEFSVHPWFYQTFPDPFQKCGWSNKIGLALWSLASKLKCF